MSVARINMLEFETEDDLGKRAELYEKDAPMLFPNAEILLTIKTGPTTAMSVSVYSDEKSAEEALIRRDKHFKIYFQQKPIQLFVFLCYSRNRFLD